MRGAAAWLGILVLGATFNWPDLIAYGAGIILGCLTEIILYRSAKPRLA
jgi:hypothetical protein